MDLGFHVQALRDATALFPHIFLFDAGRYIFGAGGVFVAVNLLLKRALVGRRIRGASPDDMQMRREFLASMRTAAIFASVGLLLVYGTKAGFFRVYFDPAALGWTWFAVSIAALVVLHDAWFYWTHRLLHHPRLFRRLHRLHHKSFNPSPWAAYAFDAGEAALNAAFLPLALLLLPVADLAIFVFLAHMMLRNAVGHCGYELFPARRDGRPAFDWMTTVTHHDLHHAQAGWNYGLYFTWWDRLLRTEHPLYHEKFAEAVRKPLGGSAVRALKPTSGATAALVAVGAVVAFLNAPMSRAIAEPSGDSSIDAIAGVWAIEGQGAHVRLEKCVEDAARLCGRMVWSWDPAIAAAQGERLLLGDFIWTGGAFEEGWLANPEDGRTYRGSIRPIEDGALELKGCAFVFCRSEIWRRLDDIPCSARLNHESASTQSI